MTASPLTVALPDEMLERVADLVEQRTRADVEQRRAEAGPPAYTVARLADAVGVSARTIRGAIAAGELQAVKRGRAWLISRAAVEAWATPGDAPTSPTRSAVGARRRRTVAGESPLAPSRIDSGRGRVTP